jgi:hypothetical protein
MQSNQVIISISIGIDGVSSQAQVEAQSGGRPAWDKLQCVARTGGSTVSYCDSAANHRYRMLSFRRYRATMNNELN